MKKVFRLFIFTILLNSCYSGPSLLSSQTNNSTNSSSTVDISINNSSHEQSNESNSYNSSEIESSSSEMSSSLSKEDSSSEYSSSSGQLTANITDLYAAKYQNNVPANYYDSCKGLKGEALKDALHNIIKGHKTYGYSSTSSFYKDIDRDPYDSGKMYFIYTGETSISTSYNKEHVWAKSHGNFGTRIPEGSDLHNLHPCNSNLNSTRSNLDFKEGGEIISGYVGNNKKTSSSFEPSDFSKGDVARTIFYMAVRYSGDGEKKLEVSSPSSSKYYDFSSGADGVHGNFDDLYKWATSGQDPVDDYEVHRNNVIYSDYQHNRNPFIDHPEFVQMIYDKNYSGKGALLDNNPFDKSTWGDTSPENEAEHFKSLVEKITTIDENSYDLLKAAEDYYNSMSDEGKQLVVEEYAYLMELKNQYEEYCDNYLVNKAIQLIDEIGEVTLESLAKIEEAEAIVARLNSSQLARVSNYQVLVEARQRYNELYEEYLKNNESNKINIDFIGIPGTWGYGERTIEVDNLSFKFSSCYHTVNEFRLGSKAESKVEDKFSSAIPGIGTNSSSMEFLFNISGLSELSLSYNDSFGTINKIYLLQSNDNGDSYEVKYAESYSSGNKEFTCSIDKNISCRYAIVIDGSKPRLCLNNLIVN